MQYDVILIGGFADEQGRPIGPYRLRTSLEQAGYSTLVIDSAPLLSQDQMNELLDCAITDQTKVIGISTIWFQQNNIGISSTYNKTTHWYHPDFFKKLQEKWPRIKLVAGGTSLGPLNDINFNFYVTGFADLAIVKLLDDITNGTNEIKYSLANGRKEISADKQYPVQDMDRLETVWKLEDNWLPHQPIPLEISRGCIFKCSFCTHPFLGKKSYEYIRSSESLASELKRNYELFGTTRYLLIDDTFNDSVEKIERLLRAIDTAKLPNFECVCYIRPEMLVTKPEMIPLLKQLGLRGGFVGLESFGAEARVSVGKGMDVERVMAALARTKEETGVKWQTGFIVGLPGDTPDMLWKYTERLKHEKIISSWATMPLAIGGTSVFMKNPEKFGFTFENNDPCNWINNVGMTAKQAVQLAIEIDKSSIGYQYVSGWHIGTHWFHNTPASMLNGVLGEFKYRGSVARDSALARTNMLLDYLKSNKK